MALLANLLFNIFRCVCLHLNMHTNHNNLNFSLSTDLQVTIFKISNFCVNAINNQP